MAKKKSEEQVEKEVIENMRTAFLSARELFGVQLTPDAVFELYDYFEEFPDNHEELLNDLKRTIEHARKVFDTTTPSADQVFGLFERIFGGDEEA